MQGPQTNHIQYCLMIQALSLLDIKESKLAYIIGNAHPCVLRNQPEQTSYGISLGARQQIINKGLRHDGQFLINQLVGLCLFYWLDKNLGKGFYIYSCGVCVCARAYAPEVSSQELFFSLHLSTRDGIQFPWLGSNHLYQLHHLASPLLGVF